jgi:transcriptional regulator with XRE-family HTH domain
MSKDGEPTFGSLVRRERVRLKIGLREMARRLGVSPTYLSMIERDKFPPPAEDKVAAIARIIGHDRDELLAVAGKVSSDLRTRIIESPHVMAIAINWASALTSADLEAIKSGRYDFAPITKAIAKFEKRAGAGSSGRKSRKKARSRRS